MKLSSLITVGTALFIIEVVRDSEAANVVQCGDIISKTTTLNDHLECDCNNGPALIVKSATLNMNKKNVSCQEGTSVPIEIPAQGVITLLEKKSKVSNGSVISNNDQFFSYGVVLGGVGKHQLSNVEAVGFDVGILIDEASSKNTISKCKSKDSDYGFFVYANSNTLEQNVATSNNYAAFAVYGNSNTLEQNEASNNYDGFDVIGNSNTLEQNEATSNNNDGFGVIGNSNTLKQNMATSNNDNGFFVSGNSNTLEKNVAKKNESDGIFVDGNSNTLKRNKATRNFDTGFLFFGDRNVLKRNKATRNFNTGFVIYDTGGGNTVKKNKAAENGLADYSVNCMTTTFVKNKGNDPCSVD